MAVRVRSDELVQEILDDSGFLMDREIAARSLVRHYPNRIKNFTELVEVVLPKGGLTTELFDILADAYENVRPKERKDP
jgi:hypothetical protein